MVISHISDVKCHGRDVDVIDMSFPPLLLPHITLNANESRSQGRKYARRVTTVNRKWRAR